MALRILVVDDVASMRRLYREFFEMSELDLEVFEAASGEEAIEFLDEHEVDVVLSDQRMGAATGIDVLVHALHHQPEAMRCMMTGYADPELETEARTVAKVHLFMEKGIGVDEIIDRLERDLTSRLRSVTQEQSG